MAGPILCPSLGNDLMPASGNEHIEELVKKLPKLTEGQIYWLLRVTSVFEAPFAFKVISSDIFDKTTLENFGDALRIHHSFSGEAFTKDKFEYVLEKVLKMSGRNAALASRGNPGHDITIDGKAVSLKTQADGGIREDRIWISKFMELGKGLWTDKPEQLTGLRNMFLAHLDQYDRILTLRALSRGPNWVYELVEIPKSLMKLASAGTLEMRLDSRQMPKPGYCRVMSERGEEIFQLYFDGGTERKLQVKNLLKSHCIVHGTWEFTIPPE
jgi:type II restriction enzyme